MIVLLLVFIVILIAFSEIGLATFWVLPLTAAVLMSIVAILGMMLGVDGSGDVFIVSAAVVAGGFGILAIITRS